MLSIPADLMSVTVFIPDSNMVLVNQVYEFLFQLCINSSANIITYPLLWRQDFNDELWRCYYEIDNVGGILGCAGCKMHF